jgi:hypothetical protein
MARARVDHGGGRGRADEGVTGVAWRIAFSICG